MTLSPSRRSLLAASALFILIAGPILPTFGVSLFWSAIVLGIHAIFRRFGRPPVVSAAITGVLIAAVLVLVRVSDPAGRTIRDDLVAGSIIGLAAYTYACDRLLAIARRSDS
ncbi:MAG: hypothetical protein SFX72_05845 [Isosphaeraceae bacterium]|nr:hypothetical protein [Isosphaeraceae bacterium]